MVSESPENDITDSHWRLTDRTKVTTLQVARQLKQLIHYQLGMWDNDLRQKMRSKKNKGMWNQGSNTASPPLQWP